jgi:hypothetical protein
MCLAVLHSLLFEMEQTKIETDPLCKLAGRAQIPCTSTISSDGLCAAHSAVVAHADLNCGCKTHQVSMPKNGDVSREASLVVFAEYFKLNIMMVPHVIRTDGLQCCVGVPKTYRCGNMLVCHDCKDNHDQSRLQPYRRPWFDPYAD